MSMDWMKSSNLLGRERVCIPFYLFLFKIFKNQIFYSIKSEKQLITSALFILIYIFLKFIH